MDDFEVSKHDNYGTMHKFSISSIALDNACQMLSREPTELPYKLLKTIEEMEDLIRMVKPDGQLTSTQIMALLIMSYK